MPDFRLNRKTGCPKCADNITLSTSEFIERSNKNHFGKYDYSQVSYSNNKKTFVSCANSTVILSRHK